jgi:hypothetical protein
MKPGGDSRALASLLQQGPPIRRDSMPKPTHPFETLSSNELVAVGGRFLPGASTASRLPNALDKSFSLFEARANAAGRPYHGGIVRENLSSYLARGLSPEAAVNALAARVPGPKF